MKRFIFQLFSDVGKSSNLDNVLLKNISHFPLSNNVFNI